jgi:hypothetical protein
MNVLKIKKSELVAICKELTLKGYTRCIDDRNYLGKGYSIQEYFSEKVGVEINKTLVRTWFKLEELRNIRVNTNPIIIIDDESGEMIDINNLQDSDNDSDNDTDNDLGGDSDIDLNLTGEEKPVMRDEGSFTKDNLDSIAEVTEDEGIEYEGIEDEKTKNSFYSKVTEEDEEDAW